MTTDVPTYLGSHGDTYARNPRAAALQWFREARYGLFLHYGVHALLRRGCPVQHTEKVPVAEYERLQHDFTAENFNAKRIAELAVDSGMRYVNITTRHHDSFCLWDTKQTDFNSVKAPAGRDLVAELAEACDERGLGLFLYYSHGRDWRHPHAPNRDEWPDERARPAYDPPEPLYAYGAQHNLDIYLEFMQAQITELLSNYGPIAGIWLDGIKTPLSGDHTRFRCEQLYDHIHSLQPQTLVSYKQGLLGTEDFVAPEHKPVGATDRSQDKTGEICTTMCPGHWGYAEAAKGTHHTVDDVWDELAAARQAGHNLLLNTAPLPDGSIDPEDETVLRAVGERLRTGRFPGEIEN